MMRVITGSARGRRLTTLEGEDIVRPTAENVKEAMFSMIQFEISGRRVLDLFGGCGQLGIEALSRGAESCVFVDKNKKSVQVIEANLRNCCLYEKASVLCADAADYLKRCGEFDIAILDPPYNQRLIDKVLPPLAAVMSDDGVIVCETDFNEALPENSGGWCAVKERKHGRTKLTLYRKAGSE